MDSFVRLAKKLEGRSYILARIFYKTIFFILGYPHLLLVRHRVRKAIGRKTFNALPSLKVASFPNKLVRATSLFKMSYSLEKVLLVCRLKPQQFDPWKEYDLILNWQDITISHIDPQRYLEASYAHTKKVFPKENTICLNFHCSDISKKHVGKIHTEVFGYSLDIDPLWFEGPAVRKSDGNATHDGQIIHCPITEEEYDNSCVYNVLIDNVFEGYVSDFRVVYMNGILDLFYEKRRRIANRFSAGCDKVAIRSIDEEFTSKEQRKINAFCKKVGFDYGELDVLRDRQTGKIYIVDVAKTPFDITKVMSKQEKCKEAELLCVAFIKNVLKAN
ncbi:MAG: hypothetical protein MI743_21650 [Sneathiellales bacterium]|nr:hypothetical protein [Sneathiellales bacterium]